MQSEDVIEEDAKEEEEEEEVVENGNIISLWASSSLNVFLIK